MASSVFLFPSLGNTTFNGNVTTMGVFYASDGTAAVPAYSFTSTPTTGWYLSGGGIYASIAGTNRVRIGTDIQTSGALYAVDSFQLASSLGATADVSIARLAAGQFIFRQDSTHGVALDVATDGTAKLLSRAGADTATFNANVIKTTGVISAGNLTPSGLTGVPVIVATGRVTAQSAANASISTFTVGAADASFEVSANLNVTASTVLTTTLTCTYTDESNTARSMIFPIQSLAGSFIAAGAITGAGASVWESPVMHIRCKAATVITILTSTGTFTGVTYTAEGTIKQTK